MFLDIINVYFILTCHRQLSTKLSTTYTNVCECMCFGRWWTFRTYYVNYV